MSELTQERVEKALLRGFSETPPSSPWGINFGGGLNSTAMIIECRRRELNPDWILFADTGSEYPGTLEHVDFMQKWCDGWATVTVVRWERVRGDVLGFEPLHENCLRTKYLPSKAYGYAGCTTKWKIQPMERWRKRNGFATGSFAIGYDAGEVKRIQNACKRGDHPEMTAWYPLVAWGIDRDECSRIVAKEHLTIGKSSCFMCPNATPGEWDRLQADHPELYQIALDIETGAVKAGNAKKYGLQRSAGFLCDRRAVKVTEDICVHAGCFT